MHPRRPLIVIVSAWLALATWWAVAAPLWEAPDAIWHYAFASHLADGGGLPRSTDEATHAPWRQEGSQPPLFYAVVAAAIAPIERSAQPWRDNPHAAVGRAGVRNVNRVLHGPEERWPWKGDVLAARIGNFVSVAFGLVGILATYAATLRLWPGRPLVAPGAAGILAFTPGYVFHSANISNDIAAAATGALVLWAAAATVAAARSSSTRLSQSVVAVSAERGQYRLMHRVPPVVLHSAALGVATGLSMMAKLSGLFVAAAAGLCALHAARVAGKPRVVGAFVLGAAVVSGWWFVRNYVHFGDPTGLPLMWAAMTRRETAPSIVELAAQLAGVWKSYWAVFGWYNLPAPKFVYLACDTIAAIGMAGVAGILIRGREWSRESVLLCGAFVIALAVGIIAWAWMQYPQGRLFFPAAPALSALLAAGWGWVGSTGAHLKRRLTAAATAVSGAPTAIATVPRPTPAAHIVTRRGDVGALVPVVPLAVMASSLLAMLVLPAYAAPWFNSPDAFEPTASFEMPTDPNVRLDLGQPAMRVGDHVSIDYGDGTELDHYAWGTSKSVTPGSVLTVGLPWRTEDPLASDLSVFLHLIDEHGLIIAQHDSMPAGGNAPTSSWPTGQWFQDRHAFKIPPGTPPCACVLVGGLYDAYDGVRLRPTAARLPATGTAGGAVGSDNRQAVRPTPIAPTELDTLGDALLLGKVHVSPAIEAGIPNPMTVRFGDRIELAGYSLPQRVVTAGAELDLTLYWRALRPQTRDLKVSVQLRHGTETWGQRDEMPADGERKTSTWRLGEVIEDRQPVPVSPDAPAGAYTLYVKMYIPDGPTLPVEDFTHEWPLAPVLVVR